MTLESEMVSSSVRSKMLSQKVALYTDVCIFVTEKMLPFTIILCSEIAEHFGLPLLESTPRLPVRMECFSQNSQSPVTAEVLGCPMVGLPTLPVLCRFTASWIRFLRAFPGTHFSHKRDTRACCDCSRARAQTPAQGEA